LRPKADPPAAVTVGGRATARKTTATKTASNRAQKQHGSHFRRRAHSGHGTQAHGFGSPSSKLFPCGFVPRNQDSTSRPYKGTKDATSRCQGMSEHAVPAAIDPVGHRPGCSHYGEVNEAIRKAALWTCFATAMTMRSPRYWLTGRTSLGRPGGMSKWRASGEEKMD
jgi:hypothetical protein